MISTMVTVNIGALVLTSASHSGFWVLLKAAAVILGARLCLALN